MTGRLTIALILLITSFFVSLFSLSFVVDEINESIEVISSDEDVFTRTELLTEKWSRERKMFSILLKHADVDTIDRFYLEIKYACERNDKEKAEEILAQLKACLIVTAETEKLKTENIF